MADYLLLEDGASHLLLESGGGALLLESSVASAGSGDTPGSSSFGTSSMDLPWWAWGTGAAAPAPTFRGRKQPIYLRRLEMLRLRPHMAED